jgi:hypothetical protein
LMSGAQSRSQSQRRAGAGSGARAGAAVRDMEGKGREWKGMKRNGELGQVSCADGRGLMIEAWWPAPESEPETEPETWNVREWGGMEWK